MNGRSSQSRQTRLYILPFKHGWFILPFISISKIVMIQWLLYMASTVPQKKSSSWKFLEFRQLIENVLEIVFCFLNSNNNFFTSLVIFENLAWLAVLCGNLNVLELRFSLVTMLYYSHGVAAKFLLIKMRSMKTLAEKSMKLLHGTILSRFFTRIQLHRPQIVVNNANQLKLLNREISNFEHGIQLRALFMSVSFVAKHHDDTKTDIFTPSVTCRITPTSSLRIKNSNKRKKMVDRITSNVRVTLHF